MPKPTAYQLNKKKKEKNTQNKTQSPFLPAGHTQNNAQSPFLPVGYTEKASGVKDRYEAKRAHEKQVIVQNTNAAYAQQRLGALTSSQKSAIENYKKYMDEYNKSSFINNIMSGMTGSLTNVDSMKYYNEAMKYKKQSGLNDDEFDSYVKNWNRYKDAVKTAEYSVKSADALNGLTDLQKEEIKKYNLAKQQYEGSIFQNASIGSSSDISAYGNTMNSYDTAVKYKNDFMSKYDMSSDEFDRMAQYVKEDADRVSMEKIIQEMQEDVADDPVKYGAFYSALDIITSPVAGVAAAGETLKSLGYADKDAPVNTNSYLYALQNMGEATEQAVSEEIGNPVGQFVYDVGVSTLKSGMRLALGAKPLRLASSGTSAYSSVLKSAQERGISKDRAMLTALSAGAAEIVSENVSLDKLYDLYKTVGKTALKDTVKKVFIQSGIEGTEEIFTELSNIITDGVINGDFSEYGMNVRNYQASGLSEGEARKQANIDAAVQVAQAGLAGFVSGGLMGGGATVASKVNYHSLGKTVNQDAETKAKVVEAARTMDDATTAKEIVTSTKAEEITDTQMGEVLESMTEVDSSKVYQILSEAAQAETESVTQDGTSAVLQHERKVADDGNIQIDNGKTKINSENINTDNGNIEINSGNTRFDTHTRSLDSVDIRNTGRTVTESAGEENSVLKSIAEQAVAKPERNYGVTRATLTGTNEPVIALKFNEVSKNKATVRLGDDTVVPLEEVQMDDRIMQNLYNFASVMDTTEAANAMVENYAGQPLTVYAQSCAVFYNAGQLKTASFEEMVQNPKNADLIAGMGDTATLYMMFSLGRNSLEKIAPVQPAETTAGMKKKGVSEGRVIDNRRDKHETRIVKVAEMVAKRTGLEITLNDSLENGERGHFEAALGRIALSSQSDNQYETLVHELMEYASTYNSEKMQEVYDMVLRYAISDMGAKNLTNAVKKYQEAYLKIEKNKTYQSASEEFVHDYLAGVFSSEDGVRGFVDFMGRENVSQEQQKSILQTVADFFRDIVKKISEYIDEHVLSYAAKKGLQADVQQAEKIRQMVLDVLEDTIGSEAEVKNVDKKYSFAGQNADTAPKSQLSNAKQMEKDGESSEEIRKKTGWHRGYDYEWRFEIDDSNLEILNVQNDDIFLDELIKHDKLFEAYPNFRFIRVAFKNMDANGSYYNGAYTIHLNTNLKNNQEKLKSTLIHEIQHAIQYEEGFATGASKEYWDNRIENGYDSRTYATRKEQAGLLSQYQNLKEQDEQFVLDMEKLESMTPMVPRGEMNWETLEQIEEDPVEWQQYDAERDRLSEKYGEEKVWDFMDLKYDISKLNSKGLRTGSDLYYNTAGEIEARETSERLKYDKTKRKEVPPENKYENRIKDEVVFAQRGKISYSIEVDQHGNEVVVLENNIFDGKLDSEKIHDYIADYIATEINNSYVILSSGQEVYIGKDLPSEFTQSEYTKSLKKKRPDLLYVKNQSAQNLKDIVEIAKDVRWEKNTKQKHNKDAKYGFYKYTTWFGVKNKNGKLIEYCATLVIRRDANKKSYLYDITDIKKVGALKLTSTSQGSHGHVGEDSPQSNPTNNSIPQSLEKVTKKLSLDVDLVSILEEEYSQDENDNASIIEEGFASLQNVTVDKRVMHKLAYKLKREYKSSYSIDDLTDNLEKVFAYLKDHKDVKYQDMVRIMQEVAKPVIEQSTDIDTWEKAVYDNFRDYFKGKTIRLNKEQREEVAYYYGTFEDFRRKNFGNISFSATNGTYINDLWEELVERPQFMLDKETVPADQPIALVDALNALKPVKRNIYGMDMEQASYDLALDIFRQFFVEQAQEKANEKVVKKALRLTERQQEYRKRVHREFEEAKARIREYDREKRANMRREYEIKLKDVQASIKAAEKDLEKKLDEQYEVKRELDRQQFLEKMKGLEKVYTEQIKQLSRENKRLDNKILYIKTVNRSNMLEKRKEAERRRIIESIKRDANSIITKFNSNTDKKHIPEKLKTPIAKFITGLDFISDRAKADSKVTLKWLNNLAEVHRRLSCESEEAEGYEVLYEVLNGNNGSENAVKDMGEFLDTYNGDSIYKLDVEGLEKLSNIIKAIKKAVEDLNRLYVNKRSESVELLALETLEEFNSKENRKMRSKLAEMGIDLNVDMMDARSYFYTLGDTALSIYDEFRTAFNERVWMLKEAQEYMADVLKNIEKKEMKKWTGKKAKTHTFESSVNEQKFQMTTAQIMSLYLLKERNQAMNHIVHGGIKPSAIGEGKKRIESFTSIKLTHYDIMKICEVLTPEQKEVADKIQKFLGTNCAAWGNKTTMYLYGYERFHATNYFPIEVDKGTVGTKEKSKKEKLKHGKKRGFTKETNEKAQNAIVVDDIFDVFTKYVVDMASYSSYTAPVMDATKWFNYRGGELLGDEFVWDETKSVKNEINRVYGGTYLKYFENLMADINLEGTMEEPIGGRKWANNLISNLKAASVGANIRVVVQQPTAYLRAAAVMSPKYLAGGLSFKYIEKMKENSAIALWKSWGYFETSIGRSMRNVLTNQTTLKERVVDKSMIGAQLMDDMTWGWLWRACEKEISSKNKEIAYDSSEYLKLVSDRFDEIIDQTQVVDTVLHKSQIMRSEEELNKMATSFMAEPIKSYNLLLIRIKDLARTFSGAKKGEWIKAGKKLIRAVMAWMFTQVINALIVSIVDVWRDWEEDGTFKEKYWNNFGENIKDNINPISMIPYVKDIISVLEGYDVNRPDMQGMSTLINSAQKSYKFFTDEEYRDTHTPVDIVMDVVKGGSQVSGIPGYNLLRDVIGIWNTWFPDAPFGGEYGGRVYTKTEDYNRMIDALLAGNEEAYNKAYEDLMSKDIEEDDISGNVMGQIKKEYDEGNLSEEEVTKLLKEEYGYSDDDIWYKLNREWGYDSKYGLLYDNIDHAFSTGNTSDRTSIRTEIEELVEHGAEKSDVASGITRKYKAQYLELLSQNKAANMKNLLISCYMFCGYTKEEAMKKIEEWSE